jgi:DNA-binding transcriptional MocR family regulator
MPPRPARWTPETLAKGQPAYIAIADAIATDIRQGVLSADDQLPPQRQLAESLGLNFSTISRAYNEAQRRGLIEARVGQGTFVRAAATPTAPTRAAGTPAIDMSMNLPPEPDDSALLAKMESAFQRIRTDVRSLLRYQPFGGTAADREVAAGWLARRGIAPSLDQTLVCAGTHSVLDALFSLLAASAGSICCDTITYTGARAVAAERGISLLGLASDRDGVTPEALDRACREAKPSAFYCNPTIQNPTAVTQSLQRRHALVDVARRYGLPIIEDDPYGLLPEDAPPSFAQLAPELTYYVGGLSKTLGAGLRLAYLVAPDARAVARVNGVLRATSVMASPISIALATQWITDGTADELVAFVRSESGVRQSIAAAALAGQDYSAHPQGFHIWLRLPDGCNRVAFASSLRESGVGVVTSDAFTVHGAPIEALRICLGGTTSRAQIHRALEIVAMALSQAPANYSMIV